MYCDQDVENILKPLCSKCVKSLQLAYHSKEEREVYCFEQESAAKELLKRYETKQFKKLEQLIISLMVVKFVNMGWEIPDFILPGVKEEVSFKRANAVNRALAKAFAKALDVPYSDLLRYKVSDEVYDEKGDLKGSLELLQDNSFFKNKKILIIQDQMSSIVEKYSTFIPNLYFITLLSQSIKLN